MKILAVNCGSSSLKFQMYEMPEEEVLISGNFERIGIENSFYSYKLNGEKIKKEAELKNHAEAVKILVQELLDNNIVESLDEIKGIGHRVVQGADKFDKSVLVNDEVIKNYFSQGFTPETIVTKLAGNNPMFKNLIEMQKKGDTKGVEQFARNFYKERGKNFDEEYAKVRNMFK